MRNIGDGGINVCLFEQQVKAAWVRVLAPVARPAGPIPSL